MNGPPRRISVHGAPGSGKTWLAERVAERLGLPLFHLDRIYLDDDWSQRPVGQANAELQAIVRRPAWVIEGIYPESYHARMEAADRIVVLHATPFHRLARLVRRVLVNRGRVQEAMPQGKPEELDWAFLRDALAARHAREVETAISEAGGERRTVHLRSTADVAMWLSRLEDGR